MILPPDATGGFMQKGDSPAPHVIVKSEGKTDLPDRVFEEAGALAAYYSKGRIMIRWKLTIYRRRISKRWLVQLPAS